ncbi:Hypothetical protein MVR_LOCUS50 [uncultured virus]|nr:Hypothetical protein MVR_LOCUS50 [uncultured virus]
MDNDTANIPQPTLRERKQQLIRDRIRTNARRLSKEPYKNYSIIYDVFSDGTNPIWRNDDKWSQTGWLIMNFPKLVRHTLPTSESILLSVLAQDPTMYKDIPTTSITPIVTKAAVILDPNNIQYVEQTLDHCNTAIQANPDTIKYIKEPTYDHCKLAVQHNGDNIQYCKDQTLELCVMAVKNKRQSVQFIQRSVMYNFEYLRDMTNWRPKPAVVEPPPPCFPVAMYRKLSCWWNL